MASVVAGGLFNAIAFAGAGYVFHKLDKSGYEKEMKRHDEAMKKLSEEKEKWYERTVEKKNKMRTTFGYEQRLRRGIRSPSQPENGYGGARRRQGAYVGRVLRTFRRDEGVYEYCYRCYRIGVRLPTHKNFVTFRGYKNNLTEISHT